MDLKSESGLDKIGINILSELQTNARTTFSEIGRRVGLSSPAVAERVTKMEESGIITGYMARIEPDKIGHPILSFIYLTTMPDQYSVVYEFIEETPEILECHCVSGSESFLLKARTRSIPDLDGLVEQLTRFGNTKTSIVLSTAFNKELRIEA